MAARKKAVEETDKLTRIAIVNADKCKPKRCRQECKKSCPVVRMGKVQSSYIKLKYINVYYSKSL